MTMKKAAVCIDDWKLSIFTEELAAAGFKFTKLPGVTRDTLTLQVETPSVEVLMPVVVKANDRAARENRKKGMH